MFHTLIFCVSHILRLQYLGWKKCSSLGSWQVDGIEYQCHCLAGFLVQSLSTIKRTQGLILQLLWLDVNFHKNVVLNFGMHPQKSAGGVLLPSAAVKYDRYLQGEVFFGQNPQIKCIYVFFSETGLGNNSENPRSAYNLFTYLWVPF